jgi:hypothetical protein
MRALVVRTILAVTLAAAAMSLLPAEEAAGKPPSGNYGFAITIDRDEDTDVATCKIEIEDLASSKLLANPEIEAHLGEETEVVLYVEEGGIKCSFALSIEVEVDRARYRFEAHHDKQIVSIQEGLLAL